jgi:hypothetical protein
MSEHPISLDRTTPRVMSRRFVGQGERAPPAPPLARGAAPDGRGAGAGGNASRSVPPPPLSCIEALRPPDDDGGGLTVAGGRSGGALGCSTEPRSPPKPPHASSSAC